MSISSYIYHTQLSTCVDEARWIDEDYENDINASQENEHTGGEEEDHSDAGRVDEHNGDEDDSVYEENRGSVTDWTFEYR
jgi:hypothetical protein